MDDKSTNIADLPFKKSGSGNGLPNPMNTSISGVRPSQQFAQQPQQIQQNQQQHQHQHQQGVAGPIFSNQNMEQMPKYLQNSGESPTLIKADVLPELKGVGQGYSEPIKPSAGKEFFGLKETDYKSTIVVFALVLIFSSNIFFETLKTFLPSVMSSDNRITLIGSLISALVAAIFYIIIKCVSNLR